MQVKAVKPYIHPGFLNFKLSAYEAWKQLGGGIAECRYPVKLLHGLFYRFEMPQIYRGKKEARLRFIEPVSVSFDAFPDYMFFEIIPMIWDCWPKYFEKMCVWFTKHKIKTAIFTSSQTAERMRQRFPEMNIMYCPEAVNTSKYTQGKELRERTIDLLEFGRGSGIVLNKKENEFKYVCTKVNGEFIYDNEQLYEAMSDAKATIALPRSITQPEMAGNIETLTQRYWESMLSRMVMIGRAPQELVDLIGYNPVVELDREKPNEQIADIVGHIDEYQEMVDKNHHIALQLGDWTMRIKQIIEWLRECGYDA